jgi:hypothetical protein
MRDWVYAPKHPDQTGCFVNWEETVSFLTAQASNTQLADLTYKVFSQPRCACTRTAVSCANRL